MNPEEIEQMLESLSLDLARVKQRLTLLESILSGFEFVSPSTFSQLLIRAPDGTALANVIVYGDIGKIVAVPFIPIDMDAAPFRFFRRYLEDSRARSEIMAFDIRERRITILLNRERKQLTAEVLGKLRWTLIKLYENQRKAETARAEASP
ncbi:MAG: hypothetical protein ACP5KV_07630 [Candidatus Methanomethylicaceae archaeon]